MDDIINNKNGVLQCKEISDATIMPMKLTSNNNVSNSPRYKCISLLQRLCMTMVPIAVANISHYCARFTEKERKG